MAGGGAASKDPVQELGRAIVAMLLDEPFYAHLLGAIPRRVGKQVPTAAVALTPSGPELIVNPDFFLGELSPKERVAVVKHEALHLVFRHLYRPQIRTAEPTLFNLAADLVVNQCVAPWPLPDSAVTLAKFPDLGLKPGQSLEWYYERLAALHEAMKAGGDGGAPLSADALRGAMASECHGDHRFWAAAGGSGFGDDADPEGAGPLGETLRRALESDLERHLLRARDRTAPGHWGKLPGGVRAAISEVETTRQPQVDWRRTLRLFATNGYRTKVVPTRRRTSKRFDDFPGLRIKREQRIAVVVDTSGSIDDTVLDRFFAEIRGIWRTGAEIVVLECDAAVQRNYPYRGARPDLLEGGGGTDFDPAFAWLRDRRNGRFDACVYLTDGFGPEPSVRPRCAVLWVVTADGGVGPHLKWGRAIRLGEGE